MLPGRAMPACSYGHLAVKASAFKKVSYKDLLQDFPFTQRVEVKIYFLGGISDRAVLIYLFP